MLGRHLANRYVASFVIFHQRDMSGAFREEVVARRTAFNLRKARERSYILCGLAVAVSNVDEVVATDISF